jgi:acyl carrier protein
VRAAVRAAATGREREAILETHLRERAAQVLRLTPQRVALTQPLRALGMDSLMTLELRNRLERDLGLPLSATVLWNYPTVAQLARHLADQIEPALRDGGEDRAAAGSLAAPAAEPAFVELDRTSVESLLERELAAIDDLLNGS